MFVALLVYILYLIMQNPYDDQGNPNPDYSTNIWSGYNYGLLKDSMYGWENDDNNHDYIVKNPKQYFSKVHDWNI